MSNTILKGWVSKEVHSEGFDRQGFSVFEEDRASNIETLPALLIIGKEGAEPRVLTGEDLDEVRKAFEFIKMKVAQAPTSSNTQYLTDIDKWANHGLASLPTL